MSRVRIIIDGIEYTMQKNMFADMMYASETQADKWFYNNTLQGNARLASKWNEISEKARDLKTSTADSIE